MKWGIEFTNQRAAIVIVMEREERKENAGRQQCKWQCLTIRVLKDWNRLQQVRHFSSLLSNIVRFWVCNGVYELANVAKTHPLFFVFFFWTALKFDKDKGKQLRQKQERTFFYIFLVRIENHFQSITIWTFILTFYITNLLISNKKEITEMIFFLC